MNSMNANIGINIKLIQKLLLYVLGFYIFYLPDFSFINPLFKNSFILVIIDLLLIVCLRKRFLFFWYDNKISKYLLGMCIINLYTLIPTLINGVQLSNNLTAIIFPLKLISLVGLYLIIDTVYIDITSKLNFLIKVGLIQAIICLLMLIVPFLKNIANIMYISNVVDYTNSPVYGITLYRIYGLTSDFTFATSIFQAMLSSVSMIFFLNSKRVYYFIAFCLLLFSSILNGRTGFLITIICIFTGTMLYAIKMRNYKFIPITIVSLIGITLFITLFIDEQWLNWIFSSFREIFTLFSRQNPETTFTTLNEYTFFPRGLFMIFGMGSRVFGDIGMALIGKSSDIGYINDIFRGGLIYILTFYSSIAGIVYSSIKNELMEINKTQRTLLIVVLLFFLLVSNYKGEAIAGSSILLGFIYFMLCLNSRRSREKNEEGVKS